MRGTEGPQMSVSSSPTLYPREANDMAICVETVLLPTPPFPLKTSMTCEMLESAFRSIDFSASLAEMAAGDENAPEEQADLLGHPSHAEALPAFWEVGPTQPSLALAGALVASPSGGEVDIVLILLVLVLVLGDLFVSVAMVSCVKISLILIQLVGRYEEVRYCI